MMEAGSKEAKNVEARSLKQEAVRSEQKRRLYFTVLTLLNSFRCPLPG